MAWAASRIALKVPTRLTLMTRMKSSSGCGPSRPTTRLAGPMPAQLMRMRAGPCVLARLRQRGGGLVGVGNVAGDGDAADLCRRLPRGVDVDVEDRDLGAGRRELRGGRAAEAGAAAGHERCMSSGMHGDRSEFRAGGLLLIATYYAVLAPRRKSCGASAGPAFDPAKVDP